MIQEIELVDVEVSRIIEDSIVVKIANDFHIFLNRFFFN